MKKNIPNFILAVLLLFINSANSQYISVDDTLTPDQLLSILFGNKNCGTISNINLQGGFATGFKSIGSFNKSTSNFPFQNGIILSTGSINSAIGPNISTTLSEGSTAWTGDNDLMQALNISNTYNASILEFDFIPLTNKFSFEYIFSSEQYLSNPTSTQCGYTDGFAFLIKPVGSANYENIALVPNTNTPVTVQSIRGNGTICTPSNESYFDAFNGYDHPTAFNGQTKILKAIAKVVPNQKYHIKLVIADQGNEKYDSSIFLGGGTFENTIDLGSDRLESLNNPYCESDKVILDASKFGNINNTYKWFKNGNPTGITTPTFEVTDKQNNNINNYSVEVMLNGTCLSKGNINVQFSTIPTPPSVSLIECDYDGDGKATFDLTKLTNTLNNNDPNLKVLYSEKSNGIEISSPDKYFSKAKTIYARISNKYNCTKETTVKLAFTQENLQNKEYEKCDMDATPDGITSFDLSTEISPLILLNQPIGLNVSYYESSKDAENKTNPLNNSYTNKINNTQKIYARIATSDKCFDIIEVTLKVNYISASITQEEQLIICKDHILTIDAPENYTSYLWNTNETTSSITINLAGTYTVELTNANGCKAIKKYIVALSAPATNIDAIVTDFSDNNTIQITYKDNGGRYEFSIDGINYQDSPFFYGLYPNEYIISIRDKNNCFPNARKTIFVLDYPRYFSPNNDGYNDTWEIKNTNNKESVESIEIYDRYGKLIKYLKPNQAWDGTYLGIPMQADDYWASIKLINGNILKKHFTIKR